MSMTKCVFEQKRMDDVQWSGVSRMSGLSSVPNDGQYPPLKTPLFYLMSVSKNNNEADVYFVNNTEQTLHFVAPFNLYRDLNEVHAKLGDISAENINKVKLYSHDMERLYVNVLPKQGVRIGSTHVIYDSDALMQWFIQVPFKSPETHYGIWRFNVVEKKGVGERYPLLWDDFSKPSHRVDCAYAFERADMPIEPTVYEERCWVFDRLINAVGLNDAIVVLAINDVLYRYGVGWNAPYNESDIQAKDIARKLQELKPKDAQAVKQIVQAVYDFWFGEGFAKTVSMQACTEIFDITHSQITNL